MSNKTGRGKGRPLGIALNADRLRELRQFGGMTQRDLAERVGITSKYVSALERGERERVSPPLFVRLVGVLGVEDRRELAKVAA